MRDPVLEHQLENLKHLMSAWQKFHTYLTEVRQREEFTQQEESAFLKLKSQIAILHDTLVDVVGTGDRDEANTVQMVIDIVERSILLRTIAHMSQAEQKRMEIEWHDGYLLMNDRIGVLEDEIESLSHVSEFHHNMQIWGRRISQNVKAVVGNRAIQFVVTIVVIVAAAIVLPALGVYDYSFLDKNDNGKTVHDWGRRLLRKSVASGLAFRSWEEYSWAVRKDGDGAGNLPGGEVMGDKTSFKNRFYSHTKSVVSGLNGINEQAKKIMDAAQELHVYADTQRTGKKDYPVNSVIAFFKTSSEAAALYEAFDKWVEDLKLKEADSGMVRRGLRGNIIVLIDTNNRTIAVRTYDRLMGTKLEEAAKGK